jgi:hypothetical protein
MRLLALPYNSPRSEGANARCPLNLRMKEPHLTAHKPFDRDNLRPIKGQCGSTFHRASELTLRFKDMGGEVPDTIRLVIVQADIAMIPRAMRSI